MRNKIDKIMFYVISLVLGIRLVKADSILLPSFIENAFEWLFYTIPERVRSGDAVAIVYFKFILWIIGFALIYYALQKSKRLSHRISIVVAVIMSLSGVLFLSDSVVLVLFNVGGIFLVIFLAFVPIMLILFLIRKIFPMLNLKNRTDCGCGSAFVFLKRCNRHDTGREFLF